MSSCMSSKVQSLGHLNLWFTLRTFLQWSKNIMLITTSMLTTCSSRIIHPSIAWISDAVANIKNCITSINKWCASKRLQLNPTKSKIIWFGTTMSLRRLQGLDLGLHVGANIITPVDVVRDLGVLFDNKLTMKKHISEIMSVCFYHLRRLKQVRRLLGPDITARLVSAFVLSQLDYCNSVLVGLPQSTIALLQEVKNAAARLIMSLGSRDHITPALHQLHWLPVKFRVTYKLCLLMHIMHVGRCSGYIADLVTQTYSPSPWDRLRSEAANRFELPAIHHKLSERAFSHAGPETIYYHTSLQQ